MWCHQEMYNVKDFSKMLLECQGVFRHQILYDFTNEPRLFPSRDAGGVIPMYKPVGCIKMTTSLTLNCVM